MPPHNYVLPSLQQPLGFGGRGHVGLCSFLIRLPRMMLLPIVVFAALLNPSALGAHPQSVRSTQNSEGQDGIVDLASLTSLTRQTQDFQPQDRFSAPLDQTAWNGQRFRVELPVRDHALLGWSYDAAEQAVLVRVEGDGFVPGHYLSAGSFGGDRDNHTGHSFHRERRARGSYRGTNAYGVAATVRTTAVTEYLLTELRPFWQPLGHRKLEFRQAANPDEARRLTSQLRVVYEGRLAARGGQVIACYERVTEPTLSTPEQISYRNCLVSVELDRISVIDSSTGSTLRAWNKDTSAPPQPR